MADFSLTGLTNGYLGYLANVGTKTATRWQAALTKVGDPKASYGVRDIVNDVTGFWGDVLSSLPSSGMQTVLIRLDAWEGQSTAGVIFSTEPDKLVLTDLRQVGGTGLISAAKDSHPRVLRDVGPSSATVKIAQFQGGSSPPRGVEGEYIGFAEINNKRVALIHAVVKFDSTSGGASGGAPSGSGTGAAGGSGTDTTGVSGTSASGAGASGTGTADGNGPASGSAPSDGSPARTDPQEKA